MGIEKLPKDYDKGKIQRIVESMGQKIGLVEKKQDQALIDLSTDFNNKLEQTRKELSDRTSGEAAAGSMSKTLPVPEDLKVKTILGMIICSVKPLSFFKYLVAGVKGYEFYGSYNSTFKPEADDYIQTGTHCGTDSSDFLWTNMSSEADPAATGTTFVFDPRVVRVLAANQLTLENLTQGTSGTLSFTPMSYMTAYKLRVVDSVNGGFLQWDTNDRWRIKEYPANRLLSIGPWAMFIKTFKTIFLDFYVKARTVGRGNSFSEFATGDTTTGDETMPAPTNLTATQRKRLVQIFTGSDVYWVQDIPYVDILLEWDDLPNEYGPMSYEISEKTPGV